MGKGWVSIHRIPSIISKKISNYSNKLQTFLMRRNLPFSIVSHFRRRIDQYWNSHIDTFTTDLDWIWSFRYRVARVAVTLSSVYILDNNMSRAENFKRFNRLILFIGRTRGKGELKLIANFHYNHRWMRKPLQPPSPLPWNCLCNLDE